MKPVVVGSSVPGAHAKKNVFEAVPFSVVILNRILVECERILNDPEPD
jgi:hypothetical protein